MRVHHYRWMKLVVIERVVWDVAHSIRRIENVAIPQLNLIIRYGNTIANTKDNIASFACEVRTGLNSVTKLCVNTTNFSEFCRRNAMII